MRLLLNSGMYKNAYTCGIPNSLFFGNEYAAALGAVAGRPEKELESLADVTEEDNAGGRGPGEGRKDPCGNERDHQPDLH